MRIPEWVRSDEWSGGLYCVREDRGSWSVEVNGRPIEAEFDGKGYVAIERTWKSDDAISLDLEMPILKVESHPKVLPNRGKVALQRGPLVFCVEAVDNGGNVRDLRLPANAKLRSEWDPELFGGAMKIRCADPELTAIPYGLWANREVGEMDVWIREDTASR